MLTPTYIVELRYTINGKVSDVTDETEIGLSETAVIDRIISGDYRGEVRAIYRVAYDEVTRDVTDHIASRVFQYANSKPVSREAEIFLDWCGYDIPDAAE